jgi:hypothetical protein
VLESSGGFIKDHEYLIIAWGGRMPISSNTDILGDLTVAKREAVRNLGILTKIAGDFDEHTG